MKARSCALCQPGPLCRLALSQASRRVGWKLSADAASLIRAAESLYDVLSADGIKLVARSNAVAHCLTALMKASGGWHRAGRAPFSLRQALARAGLAWLRHYVTLIEATPHHLDRAGEYWFAHYREDLHDERAGFEDYLDAAVVLSPPAAMVIRHAVVDHGHLSRILGKCGARVPSHFA